MRFRVLPAEIIRKLTQGIEDTLTPLAEKRQYAISSKPCARCGGAMHGAFYGEIFRPNDPLPRTVARCVDCGYTYDHETGLVLNTGNPALVEEALPLIRPKED